MTKSLRQYDMVAKSSTQIKKTVRSGMCHCVTRALYGRSGSSGARLEPYRRVRDEGVAGK